jgi:hypothetical protein
VNEDSILSCGLDDLRHSPSSFHRDSSVCDAESQTALTQMFDDFWDNTTKFSIKVCFASSDAGDVNTSASSTSSCHSRFLEASGFSTHIEHLPPSVSSPRSQWRWSNYPLPLPGGTEGFRIRRASAPCPSPLVPRFQVRHASI